MHRQPPCTTRQWHQGYQMPIFRAALPAMLLQLQVTTPARLQGMHAYNFPCLLAKIILRAGCLGTWQYPDLPSGHEAALLGRKRAVVDWDKRHLLILPRAPQMRGPRRPLTRHPLPGGRRGRPPSRRSSSATGALWAAALCPLARASRRWPPRAARCCPRAALRPSLCCHWSCPGPKPGPPQWCDTHSSRTASSCCCRPIITSIDTGNLSDPPNLAWCHRANL